jgi:endonuclease/exonuclease/phosphatase family metal-dependent hydrolase
LESDQKTVLYSKNIAPSPIFNGNLNIATFNMKLGFCKDCNPFSGKIGGDHQQLDRIVDMINQMNLKIITLQEVGYEYYTSIIEDQISYIAERTQMNYAFGTGRAFQTGDNLFLRGFIGNLKSARPISKN